MTPQRHTRYGYGTSYKILLDFLLSFMCFFFVVHRSTFIIPETDDTVFNIKKFTPNTRTENCMNWVGGRGG